MTLMEMVVLSIICYPVVIVGTAIATYLFITKTRPKTGRRLMSIDSNVGDDLSDGTRDFTAAMDDMADLDN